MKNVLEKKIKYSYFDLPPVRLGRDEVVVLAIVALVFVMIYGLIFEIDVLIVVVSIAVVVVVGLRAVVVGGAGIV